MCEQLETKDNSPLEGWQPKADGVDSSNWKDRSLFPYWDLPKNRNLVARAKELRKKGILAEVLFWKTFNNKSMICWDIDRQVIIGNYIVDFFIAELGLVIEIDGCSHEITREYDYDRDEYLRKLGLEVIHILDKDVKYSMDVVFRMVTDTIARRTTMLKELRIHPVRYATTPRWE